MSRGLSTADVAKVLLSCRPLPDRVKPFTMQTLPAERTQAVKDTLRDHAPLPDDVFFDGRSYVSMDGTRSEHHPDIDSALTQLLEEMNAEVHARNLVADAAAADAETEGQRYLVALSP